MVWKPFKSKVDAKRLETWEISRKSIIELNILETLFNLFGCTSILSTGSEKWFGAMGIRIQYEMRNQGAPSFPVNMAVEYMVYIIHGENVIFHEI